MSVESKLFDKIRIRPDPAAAAERLGAPACEWAGCTDAGTYRAPKGRGREGQYHRFCLDHVRDYNRSYNYFAGMADDAVAAYQKDALTGHRPTWGMGTNGAAQHSAPRFGQSWEFEVSDPFQFMRGPGAFRATPGPEPEGDAPRRRLKPLEQRSFDALDLDANATGPEIKARYKALVKLHHPDANGGDRSFEDRLRQIIQAYNHLKSAGFC